MRLASDFWVSALIRRADAAGVIAVVRRRGDDRAGAIAVVVDRLDGTLDLCLPLPQSEFGEDAVADRRFEIVEERVESAVIERRLASEMRFDPDIWVIEIEDRAGRHFIEPPPRRPGEPEPAKIEWPPRG